MQSDKLAFSMKEAAKSSGLSVGTLYNFARRGRLKLIKAGRRTLVPRAELDRLLSLQQPGPKFRYSPPRKRKHDEVPTNTAAVP